MPWPDAISQVDLNYNWRIKEGTKLLTIIIFYYSISVTFFPIAAVTGWRTRYHTLLLGVADSGKICGIDADEFENNDRCLLHVKNLLNQYIGAEFSSYILTTILECSEGSAVMLECRPAGAAVF